jgi:hypothetical protein
MNCRVLSIVKSGSALLFTDKLTKKKKEKKTHKRKGKSKKGTLSSID